MTDLIDQRTRSTLSDDEVWPSPMHLDSTGWLSGAEVTFGPTSYGVGSLARFTHVQPRPTHGSALDLLRPLVELDNNWDGEGALAPTPRALRLASQFLGALSQPIPLPDVMASVTGGILLEWESTNTDLLIEIESSGTAVVFVRQGDHEEEGPLVAHSQAATEALAALVLQRR